MAASNMQFPIVYVSIKTREVKNQKEENQETLTTKPRNLM